MKSFFRVLLFSTILFISEDTFAQYITIDESYTAQQLVEDVLVNSTCASVSNFSVSGGNFSGGATSYAYFTNASPAFPFASGIVLSTGRATSAQGPNTSLSDDGGGMGWNGDTDLQQALNISNSVNRTILEFDFIPQTNKISFDYIFASEEYHGTAPCSYSDGFAFLLRKVNSNDQYENLAIIPGTTTPVKVTTVRPNIPGSCAAQNEAYFDFSSYNVTMYPTNFNGQTVVMKAMGDVEIGELYHIKLVIADEGNYRYDSAIFLGGGSFQSAVDLGPDQTISTNNPFCAGENVTLNALQSGTNTYKWFKDGVEILGESNPTYTITDNTNTNVVDYTVEVMINGTCLSSGDIKIQFAALPVLSNQTLVQCDDNNDGNTIFNLTVLDDLIKNGDTSLSGVVYYETIGGTPIADPSAYSSSNSTIYAQVANDYRCISTATITLQISNNTITSPVTYKKCDEDGTLDGKTNFDLNLEITPSVLAGLPPGLIVKYYASENDAVLQNNPLPNNFQNTTPNEESIYARIVNGPDCYGIMEVKLKVNVFTPSNFEKETVGLCVGNTITLSVENIFSAYNWNNGDTDYQTDVAAAGTYTVEVTDANGCKATKTFIVQSSAPATDIDAEIVEFSGDNNSVVITYTNNGGDYVFSIDGINYQESPTFTNVTAGEYTIYVKDMNGCLPTPFKTIYILDYPKFFTPNGDGIHDTWAIKNIKTRPNSAITIFDRFGKLIKQFDSNSNGWNGTFNGQNLPSGDYWFTLILYNGKTVKSHFTLKR